jgi:hypothetical protein
MKTRCCQEDDLWNGRFRLHPTAGNEAREEVNSCLCKERERGLRPRVPEGNVEATPEVETETRQTQQLHRGQVLGANPEKVEALNRQKK